MKRLHIGVLVDDQNPLGVLGPRQQRNRTFGGPDTFSREMGGFSHLIALHRHLEITEPQRLRFVELYMAAADEELHPLREIPMWDWPSPTP